MAAKQAKGRPLTLAPLTPEQALAAAMQVPPEPQEKRKRRDRKTKEAAPKEESAS